MQFEADEHHLILAGVAWIILKGFWEWLKRPEKAEQKQNGHSFEVLVEIRALLLDMKERQQKMWEHMQQHRRSQ